MSGARFEPTVPFDPAYLVRLAREQFPARPALAEALSHCLHGCVRSVAYIRFVDSTNANQPGADWQFAESVELVGPHASYVVDVLRDGRIGGVEFMAMLPFVR